MLSAFELHEDQVRSVGFSADGSKLLTASDDKSARLWSLFPTLQALVDRAKDGVPRCLTRGGREAAFLAPEPPAWCIEMEKWPYNTPAWKQWLTEKRAGKQVEMPAE